MGRRVMRGMAVSALVVCFVLGGLAPEARAQGELLDRQWYHAHELTAGLRAEPHHAVMLHLESTGARGKTIRNSIPYHFRRSFSFNFCVPDDDPHITGLTVTREGSSAPVVHVSRGGPCKTRTITPGFYVLHVDHDARRVPAEGVKAFLHVPRRQLAERLDTPPGGDSSSGGAPTLAATTRPKNIFDSSPQCNFGHPGQFPLPTPMDYFTPNNPLYTMKVDSTRYLNPPIGTDSPAGHGVHTVLPAQQTSYIGWSVCRDGGNVYFFNGVDTSNEGMRMLNLNTLNTPAVLTEAFGFPSFFFPALVPVVTGDWQFTLQDASGSLKIVNQATGTAYELFALPTQGSTFTALYATYRQGAQIAAPQAGEVHLLNAPCFSGSAPAATYVPFIDLPDLNEAGIRGFPTMVVRLGPQTAMKAFPETGQNGTPIFVANETTDQTQETCLTAIPKSISIVPITRDFIAAAKTCLNCDLTGMDLSNLDLSGGKFTGTSFHAANLTNTNFQSATLDGAKFSSYNGQTILTGTNFAGALLGCANHQNASFQNSVLYHTTFWVPKTASTPAILPVIPKDQSCWVELQYAQLNWNTFPVDDWRYLFLNNATIVGASAQPLRTMLTATPQPLDLSGARLSQTAGLTQVDLTGANLSVANLSQTNLSGATLAHASVAGTSFSGANLTSTNLTSVTVVDPVSHASVRAIFSNATLTLATLNTATLDGSDFTGAVLNQASLQRTSLASATLLGANFNFANLDGANLHAASGGESGVSGVAASFNGAFMRNVNLAKASFAGVKFRNANFYSTFPVGSCNPSGASGFLTTCASAVGTSLDSADFQNAFLYGTDFSGVSAQIGNFGNAILVGANFSGASLPNKPGAGSGDRVEFSGAWLHGAEFGGASAPGADFTLALVNRTTNASGGTAYPILSPDNLKFRGYLGDGPPTIQGCVSLSYDGAMTPPDPPTTPLTCPDGASAITCTNSQWEANYADAMGACNDDAVDFNF